jgi:membrane protein implicated in regulation of membrane protease activity
MDALLWLIVAVVLGGIEVASGVLVPIFFAMGALAAALVALGVDSVIIESLVFLGVSVASLGTIRRPLQTRFSPPQLRSGVQALIGRDAVVVQRIDNDENTGQVRIGGEVWRARAFGDEQTFEEGAKVQVTAFEGVTALVL